MLIPVRWRSVVSASAAAIAAAALTAAPASAAVDPTPAGCAPVATFQAFAPWGDASDYLLAPDGGIEDDAAGWQLEDGARAVAGNEPFQVGGPDDRRSLELPAGATATTPPMCIGVEHRTMRFFGKAARTGALKVEVLYTKSNGKQKSVTLGAVRGEETWAPSDVLPMRVNELAEDYDNAMDVALRFSVKGNATWTIDDVYVDPYRMK
jgi:hypothetical protein